MTQLNFESTNLHQPTHWDKIVQTEYYQTITKTPFKYSTFLTIKYNHMKSIKVRGVKIQIYLHTELLENQITLFYISQ